MVLAAAGTVWLLLGTGVGGDQLDAIRTGSALGVGLGGIVVLWLAVRRQRSTELDLLQKYEAHQLAEQVAAASERDATSRRITDLYAKAVDQLGSDKAPVRLGGLYALERLAQDNADRQLRQTVVNVICAYLRMPALAAEPDETQQEHEVRLTARRILEDHLRPGQNPDSPLDTFWPDIDVDLSGAILTALNLSGCRLRNIRCTGTRFTNGVLFEHAQIGGSARFKDAEFGGDATFSEVSIAGDASFADATFGDNAFFNVAVFGGQVDFGRATFTGVSMFASAKCADVVWFDKAEFGGHATFAGVTFAEWFEEAEFAEGVNFTAFVRVDILEADDREWPDGWVPTDDPAPLEGQQGMWVSLARI